MGRVREISSYFICGTGQNGLGRLILSSLPI